MSAGETVGKPSAATPPDPEPPNADTEPMNVETPVLDAIIAHAVQYGLNEAATGEDWPEGYRWMHYPAMQEMEQDPEGFRLWQFYTGADGDRVSRPLDEVIYRDGVLIGIVVCEEHPVEEGAGGNAQDGDGDTPMGSESSVPETAQMQQV